MVVINPTGSEEPNNPAETLTDDNKVEQQIGKGEHIILEIFLHLDQYGLQLNIISDKVMLHVY